MAPGPLARLRKLCLALPEAVEVEAWGAPTFRVRGRLFAMFAHASDHHGGGRDGVWIKATRDNQALMIHSDPGRFFFPPYLGPSGWVGVYLDAGAAAHSLAPERVTRLDRQYAARGEPRRGEHDADNRPDYA